MEKHENPDQAYENKIFLAHRVDQVRDIIKDVPVGSQFWLDVDDMLQVFQSWSFRVAGPLQIINRIKANKHLYPNYTQILSSWRRDRKVELVDPQWPDFIRDLKQKHCVYALTKMDTGVFGVIPSMEEWRYNELRSLGIEFSSGDFTLSKSVKGGPTFQNGILMTGTMDKDQALEAYRDQLTVPPHLVFMDDAEENVKKVQAYALKYHIPFTGVVFRGVDHLPGEADPALSAFQEKHLVEKCQWLEDEEARKLLNQHLEDVQRQEIEKLLRKMNKGWLKGN